MPNPVPNSLLNNPVPENLPIIAPTQVAFYKRPVVWGILGLALMVAGGAIYLRMQSKSIPTVVVETATLGPVTRVLAVNGKIAAQGPSANRIFSKRLCDDFDHYWRGLSAAVVHISPQA